MAKRSSFTDQQKATARRLLDECGIPRDQLPYTTDFYRLHGQYCDAMKILPSMLDYNTFWRLLSSAAKKGGLARQRKPRKKPAPDNS
jgi:hypothetical protein